MPRVSYYSVELRRDSSVLDLSTRTRSLKFKDSLLLGDLEWELQLYAETVTSDEAIFFEPGQMELRISFTLEGQEQTTDWRTIVLRSSQVYFYGTLALQTLTGGGMPVLMNRRQRWRGFVEKNPIDIFRTISGEYDMSLKAAEVNTVSTWYQSGETDWDFLQGIAKEIVSAAGQLNLWLHARNRVLKLEPLQFADPVVREFNFLSGDDRLQNITFGYNNRVIDYLGGGVLVSNGFDLKNKVYLEEEVPLNILPALASRHPRELSDGHTIHTTPYTKSERVSDEGKNRWLVNTSKYFFARATILGDLTLRPGDIVNLQVVDPDGSLSSLNGKYPVYEVVHTFMGEYGKGGKRPLETHIGCYRQTSNYGRVAPVGTNQSRVVSRDDYDVLSPLPERKTTIQVRTL